MCWIEQRLLPVAGLDAATRHDVIVGAWRALAYDERLAFNKLLTGALRVGVSQRLVQQALAEMSGVDIARIAQRMLGAWSPSPAFLRDLLTEGELPGDRAQPYPFFLASPLEAAPETLGAIDDWLLEWKWDGIRVQLIRRGSDIALWSRGEERLDGRFPEIEAGARHVAGRLPCSTASCSAGATAMHRCPSPPCRPASSVASPARRSSRTRPCACSLTTCSSATAWTCARCRCRSDARR